MTEYGIDDREASNLRKRDVIEFVSLMEWKGYVLNLSYVTPKVAVMCAPDPNGDILRNNVFMIADYIHETCGSNFYLVNLHEKSYDYSLFDNQVLDFQFPDHCAPRLSFVEAVARAMDNLKQRIPEVTFFVHCRAGRGRSALITAAYLLFTREADTHDIAIDMVNAGRSPVARMAMSMPSQHRYLHHFELYCKTGAAPCRRL
jgi:protein-tyrosine phosphatase